MLQVSWVVVQTVILARVRGFFPAGKLHWMICEWAHFLHLLKGTFPGTRQGQLLYSALISWGHSDLECRIVFPINGSTKSMCLPTCRVIIQLSDVFLASLNHARLLGNEVTIFRQKTFTRLGCFALPVSCLIWAWISLGVRVIPGSMARHCASYSNV